MHYFFPRFDEAEALTELPEDLALLMVGIAARQAASATAACWARQTPCGPPRTLLAPAGGAFNGAVAAALEQWHEE